MSRGLLRALTAEAIGTFALVFAGCGAIMVDAKTGQLGHVGVAITFGLVIMFGIYAVGHISGAHFNAAVTFAFALTRHFPWPRALAYWGAQLVGALAAAALLRVSLGNIAHVGATLPSGSRRAGLSLGAGDERVPDVRDPRGRDRHARGRGGGGDRDRRHDRPRRDVRRPDHGRVDEPDPLARARRSSPATCTRSGSTSPPPSSGRRSAGSRISSSVASRPGLRARPRWMPPRRQGRCTCSSFASPTAAAA